VVGWRIGQIFVSQNTYALGNCTVVDDANDARAVVVAEEE